MMHVVTTETKVQYPKCSTPQEIREKYKILSEQDLPEVLLRDVRSDLEQCAIDKNSSSEDLITIAKRIPALEFLFKQDARILEGYTIEEHTSMVINQLDRYLSSLKVDCLLSHSELRIVMLFHDIGKSLPDEKKEQHFGTLQVMKDFEAIIPLSDKARAVAVSLIGNDPIGRFLVSTVASFADIYDRKNIAEISRQRSVTIEELQVFADIVQFHPTNQVHRDNAQSIINKISQRALELSVDPEHLLNLHIVSYQADTSAYTYDAVAYNGKRAYPGLDFIYTLDQTFSVEESVPLLGVDPKTGLIRFSKEAHEKIGLLKI